MRPSACAFVLSICILAPGIDTAEANIVIFQTVYCLKGFSCIDPHRCIYRVTAGSPKCQLIFSAILIVSIFYNAIPGGYSVFPGDQFIVVEELALSQPPVGVIDQFNVRRSVFSHERPAIGIIQCILTKLTILIILINYL